MIKCKKCSKSHIGIIRTKKTTEYRVLQNNLDIGKMSFKGNWKTEQNTTIKEPLLKCLACETIILSVDDLIGCSGYTIKSDGVIFTSDGFNKFI